MEKRRRELFIQEHFLQWEKYSVSATPRKERCKQQAGKQYQVVVILWENVLKRKGSPRQVNLQMNLVNSLEVWKYSLGGNTLFLKKELPCLLLDYSVHYSVPKI